MWALGLRPDDMDLFATQPTTDAAAFVDACTDDLSEELLEDESADLAVLIRTLDDKILRLTSRMQTLLVEARYTKVSSDFATRLYQPPRVRNVLVARAGNASGPRVASTTQQ